MSDSRLVAGIDSSTQSCKVVICDAATGVVQRHGSAPHPSGTEVHPDQWWQALTAAVAQAGGLHDVAALSVGGQQHGLVCLDSGRRVIRPALLWNDTRSAAAADDLVDELGDGGASTGAQRWAEITGSVPVAAFTVSKLRWLADHEPDRAGQIAAVALPHDWLTWRLGGATSLHDLTTERSDASGTGYFDARASSWRRDLLAMALRRTEADAAHIVLPRIVSEGQPAGRLSSGLGWGVAQLAGGCGDNAGAALGLQLQPGDVMVSVGTSGVIAAVSSTSTHDATGAVAGFADATGHYLPLACTLNASRILDASAHLLGVDHRRLSELAFAAPSGAGGLVFVPYLEGERTPNLPDATGTLHHLTVANMTPQHLARAAVEGLLCLLADALESVRDQGVSIGAVTLIGGASQSTALRELAPAILGVPVAVPATDEYVALGAARQAAWVLSRRTAPPRWTTRDQTVYTAAPDPSLLRRYRRLTPHADDRSSGA